MNNLKIIEFTEDIRLWIEDGNAEQLSNGNYVEQSSQWKKEFNKQQLIDFFVKEFLSLDMQY